MIPVVPAGRGAVGIQIYIAAVELPQQRGIATKYQTVVLHAVVIVHYHIIYSAKIHIYINNSKCFHQKVDHLDTPIFLPSGESK